MSNKPFTVETLGGPVSCEVSVDGKSIKVEMGEVSFNSTTIPVVGASRAVLNEKLEIHDHKLKFCAATVGNPHCVVFSKRPTSGEAHR